MRKFVIGGAIVACAILTGARRVDPPRIGVVDMSRLVSEHKTSRDEQSTIQQWKTANLQQLDDEQKKLKDLKADLDQYKDGSDELRRKQLELKFKQYEFDGKVDAFHDEFDRRVGKSLVDSHARVVAACRTYLDTHDLDAVLQYASSPVNGAKSNEVIPEIVVRTVVAYKKTIDVTDAVLAILDAGK